VLRVKDEEESRSMNSKRCLHSSIDEIAAVLQEVNVEHKAAKEK
jgi:hypothetical protein